jgi:hypothetical protein
MHVQERGYRAIDIKLQKLEVRLCANKTAMCEQIALDEGTRPVKTSRLKKCVLVLEFREA